MEDNIETSSIVSSRLLGGCRFGCAYRNDYFTCLDIHEFDRLMPMDRMEITLDLNEKTINRLNFYANRLKVSQGEALEQIIIEARVKGYMAMAGLLIGMIGWAFALWIFMDLTG